MFHSNLYSYSRQSGFTLVEMLVVVTIIAIIAAMAYPSMQQQIAKARMTQTAGDIETALKTARANALIQKRTIDMVINASSGEITVAGQDGVSFNYPNKVIVTPQRNSTTFTPQKTANNNRYEVCYKDMPLQRIVVSVDVRSNVTVSKNDGACS